MADAGEDRRLRFDGVTLALSMGFGGVDAVFRLGWASAFFNVGVLTVVYVGYIYRYRDALLLRLFLLGFAAGWVELLADWYLVAATHTLVYPGGEPFVVRSPLYMPLAWTSVVFQLGYLGTWLDERRGLAVASFCTALAGSLNIPLYEELAKRAGWWWYQDTRFFLSVPWYIVGSEFLIAAALPAAARVAARSQLFWSLAAGIVLGLWMWISCVISFRLFG